MDPVGILLIMSNHHLDLSKHMIKTPSLLSPKFLSSTADHFKSFPRGTEPHGYVGPATPTQGTRRLSPNHPGFSANTYQTGFFTAYP